MLLVGSAQRVSLLVLRFNDFLYLFPHMEIIILTYVLTFTMGLYNDGLGLSSVGLKCR